MHNHFEKSKAILTFDVPKEEGFKGGPSDIGTKILQKYQKIILVLPKPYEFHSLNLGSQKTSDIKRN